jgi:hypothetical protein
MKRALEKNGGEDLNNFLSAPMMVIKHLIESQVRETLHKFLNFRKPERKRGS